MTIRKRVYRWKLSTWLRITGPDAANFLQGQFTNELREIGKVPAVYGLWLTQKGKVLADSFVVRADLPETFWVGSYFSPAAVIKERLESYIIADDVTVTDETEQWIGTTVTGPAEVTAGEYIAFPGRRGLGEHWEYVGRQPLEIAEATNLTDQEMTLSRIQAGIPAIPQDIGLGDLPNEGGLDASAISYTKGCYLGQEVMARLKNLGQVRRRLMHVKGPGVPPPCPATLFQHGKKVGEIRSGVSEGGQFLGLALLTTLNLEKSVRLSLAPDGPALVEWSELA